MKKQIVLVFLCVVILTYNCPLITNTSVADGQIGKLLTKEELVGVPPELLNNDNNKATQNQVVIRASLERQNILRSLYLILREDTNDDNRNRIASGIKLAGIMRADIPILITGLINKIDFLEYGRILGTRPFGFRTEYIAVESLIQIGKPSIAPTIKRLSIETDPFVRAMLVRVIQDVEGKEIGTLLLNKEIQQTEGQKKQNLEEALKLLK